MTTEIIVRKRCVGFHNWPGATEDRDYLASRHRHTFTVTACMEVWHDDRDVEFHDLLDVMQPAMPEGENFHRSCEQMAQAMVDHLSERYPRRVRWVEVWEDDECGARVTT